MTGDRTSRHPAYSLYLYGIVALGMSHLAFSISLLPREGTSPHWVMLASLTIISAAFTIKIPRIDSKISASDIFVFSNMVLFGPAIGSITAALDGFMGSIRSRTTQRRLQFVLFNMSTMAIAAALSGRLFRLLTSEIPRVGGPATDMTRLAVPMGIMVLVYYLLNSGSVALIVSLEQRKKVLAVWKDNILWSLVTYFTGAFVAVILVRNLTAITPALVIVIIPIILVTYLSYKTYVENIREREHSEELKKLYLSTVETLAMAVDAKDRTTHGHIRRVRAYAVGLARLCGVKDGDELAAIETGALLHDIGKLAIEDHILNKPGRLTKQEFEIMKLHASAGGEILEQIPFPYPVARYVRAHHERWDGLGYPDGLKGEEIPLGARILSIADAFDAVRSTRPYKKSFTLEDSTALLRAQAGTQFDPRLVGLFLENLERIERSADAAADSVPDLAFRKRLESTLDAGKTDVEAHRPALSRAACTDLLAWTSNLGSLGAGIELQDLLAIIAARLRRLLPFDTCAFFLNHGDNTLKAAYVAGEFADQIRNQTVTLGRGISGWVAAYERPMMNTCPELEFLELSGDFSVLTDVLAVPIHRDGAAVGTISLYTRGPSMYTNDHLAILETAARRVASFVGRALDLEVAAEADRESSVRLPHLPAHSSPISLDRPQIHGSLPSGVAS